MLAASFIDSTKRYFDGVISQGTHLDMWNEMKDYYTSKLWHQLSHQILNIVSSKLEPPIDLQQLYHEFVLGCCDNFNIVVHARIVFEISKTIPDFEIADNFLVEIANKMQKSIPAVCICNVGRVHLLIDNKNYVKAKNVLSNIRNSLATLDEITVAHEYFYFACLKYHKIMGNYYEYYTNALLYLDCVPLAKHPDAQKKSLALEIAVAALLSRKVYAFGELLNHPIVSTLKSGEFFWVADLLEALSSGNLQQFNELQQKIQLIPDLWKNQAQLSEKVIISSLVSLFFRRPQGDRVISFQDISRQTNIPIGMVDKTTMTAFSLGVMKGRIDQIKQDVQCSWIQPRVLTVPQISVLKGKMEEWLINVEKTISELEEQLVSESEHEMVMALNADEEPEESPDELVDSNVVAPTPK